MACTDGLVRVPPVGSGTRRRPDLGGGKCPRSGQGRARRGASGSLRDGDESIGAETTDGRDRHAGSVPPGRLATGHLRDRRRTGRVRQVGAAGRRRADGPQHRGQRDDEGRLVAGDRAGHGGHAHARDAEAGAGRERQRRHAAFVAADGQEGLVQLPGSHAVGHEPIGRPVRRAGLHASRQRDRGPRVPARWGGHGVVPPEPGRLRGAQHGRHPGRAGEDRRRRRCLAARRGGCRERCDADGHEPPQGCGGDDLHAHEVERQQRQCRRHGRREQPVPA